MTDLLRAVDFHPEISCVRLASYKGTKSTGKLTGLETIGDSFKGRDVLIIDDILDTGLTLSLLVSRLKKLGARDVKCCVLLKKRGKQTVTVRADWVGFTIPDHFAIGYGLDLDGKYRGLKQVRVLD